MNYKELDKKVVDKQKNQPKRYSFNLSEIDDKIEAPYLTKNDEQLYLYRKRFRIKDYSESISDIYTVFYIINQDGEVCGRVPVYINEKPNQASIDYFFKPNFQNQGIGSVAVALVLSQIFAAQIFDGYYFNSTQGRVKTHIKEIRLAINTDNIPSRKLACKLGFSEDKKDPTQFILTKNKYFGKDHDNNIERT